MSQEAKEKEPTMADEVREAFATPRKLTVTPRGGEPTELIIRPLTVEQALGLIDQIEKVWDLMREMSDEKGDVNVFEVFRKAREEVLVLIETLIEKDRAFVMKLELPDLMSAFEIIFTMNKDFFGQRAIPMFQEMFGLVSSMQ